MPQRNQRNQRFNGAMQNAYFMVPRPPLIAPDRFLSRSHVVELNMKPETLVNGSVWDDLSRSMWNKFLANQQTEQTFRKKMMLWRYLYMYIKVCHTRDNIFVIDGRCRYTLQSFPSLSVVFPEIWPVSGGIDD